MKSVLKRFYGIDSAEVKEIEGGFAARAFIVKDISKADYFLKVYEKKRQSTTTWTRLLNEYQCVTEFLFAPMQGKICRPVETVSGLFFCEDDDNKYVVFRYIKGKALGFDNPYSKSTCEFIGESLKRLHSIKEPVPFGNKFIEDFSVPFCHKTLELAETGIIKKDSELFALLCPSLQALRQKIQELLVLSRELKTTPPPLVPCHTDVHGGNIMDDGKNLYLIDWEGFKLAPREADLFAVLGTEYEKEIMKSYDHTYKVNRKSLEFYNTRRLVEDIYEFIVEILREDISNEGRKRNLDALATLLPL